METTGIRRGMGILHSDVLDSVSHSGDARDYAIKLNAEYCQPSVQNELNIVLLLLVTFH